MGEARRRRSVRGRVLSAVSAALAAVMLVGLAGCSAETEPQIPLPEQASGDLPAATVEQLDAALDNALAASAASGAIVGVWVPWSGSWVTARGEDPSGRNAATDMVFRAGDVTRMMTCDVLYAVAAEGVVDLDDPVSEHVRGYPTLDDMTLEQLCDGTSGAGSFEPTLRNEWLTNPDRRWNPLELTGYGFGAGDTPVSGTGYDGSDAGYVLLGLALQSATGMSASALIDQYVARPLGLESTRLPGSAPGLPGEAFGASPQPSLRGFEAARNAEGAPDCADMRDVSSRSASGGFTDSGVVSTVDDLGRYARAVATGELGTDDDGRRWAEGFPARQDAPSWFTAAGGALQAGTLVGQYSSVPGYATAVFADTTTGLTVVAVLNNSTAAADLVGSFAWELAAIASKAPAASGFTDPAFGLPWTQEQFREAVSAAAVCS